MILSKIVHMLVIILCHCPVIFNIFVFERLLPPYRPGDINAERKAAPP